jgi:hypothetical protein
MPYKDPHSVTAQEQARRARYKYRISPKGRARRARYRVSPKGRASMARTDAKRLTHKNIQRRKRKIAVIKEKLNALQEP